MFDLLIRDGTIIDGTGSEGYRGSVAVAGDTLQVLRGRTDAAEAARTIDADGMVVCPGFVDLHSHAGLTILGAPDHGPKVRQGVTTELIGIDGISHAPFRTVDELNRYIWMDSGLNGYPPVPADWLTVAEQLTRYDRRVAINMAIILGNSPARIWSVGWDDVPAGPAQIAEMRSVVREAMEEGAWGLSTGLDYPPGSFASTDELVALSEVVAELGGFYHTHTRASLRARGRLAPWEEAIEIGERSGAPVHLTHYRQQRQGDGSHLDYLGLVEGSRARGMDVTFDCYTYPYSGTSLTIQLPMWARQGGPEGIIAALTDPETRARIARELGSRPDPAGRVEAWHELWLTAFRRPENALYDGRSLAEIAQMRGQEPPEAMMDLLLSESLGISQVGTGTNPQTLPAFVSHPMGMIASDAILIGEYPNPRSYGCFPVVLAEFVRAERCLRLPEAIRKMTSFPAQRLGLRDRGLLRGGYRADIVVFDPERVSAPATRLDPRRDPVGIEYVIVNGEVVIDRGEGTGALPGRALRRGRD